MFPIRSKSFTANVLSKFNSELIRKKDITEDLSVLEGVVISPLVRLGVKVGQFYDELRLKSELLQSRINCKIY